MDKKVAFWIFLLGTLSSSILFLILTFDTHRQVRTLTKEENLNQDVVSEKRYGKSIIVMTLTQF